MFTSSIIAACHQTFSIRDTLTWWSCYCCNLDNRLAKTEMYGGGFQPESRLHEAGCSAMNGQKCVAHIETPNGAQRETVRLNTAVATADVDDTGSLK